VLHRQAGRRDPAQALADLGVAEDRIYTAEGLTGTKCPVCTWPLATGRKS